MRFCSRAPPAGIAVRSPSSHAKSAQSQPNLPAHPAAAGSHAKSARRQETALARFAAAGDYNRRPPQPSVITTAARAASAISGQNLVEGFAGAGVGVDRAGQVGGGQALLDSQRHQVDQLLGVDH